MRYAAAIWTRRWSMLIAASLVVSLNVTQPSAAAKVQPAPDSALAGRPSPDQSDSSAKSQPISLTVNAVTGSSISIGWSGRGGNPRSGGVAGYRLFQSALTLTRLALLLLRASGLLIGSLLGAPGCLPLPVRAKRPRVPCHRTPPTIGSSITDMNVTRNARNGKRVCCGDETP